MSLAPAVEVYQLRVYLRQISPMIWRRLLVRSDGTIADLHYRLQIAMGWTDSHLNRFVIRIKEYGVAHIGGMSFTDDPREVRLVDYNFRPFERFLSMSMTFVTNGSMKSGWKKEALSIRV